MQLREFDGETVEYGEHLTWCHPSVVACIALARWRCRDASSIQPLTRSIVSKLQFTSHTQRRRQPSSNVPHGPARAV